jgi:uncharacterized protein (DUF885 family)
LAHQEGWGLYSESLGFELGLLDSEATEEKALYDLLGYYSFMLMRTGNYIYQSAQYIFFQI